jgi:hypothetical protein
MSPHARPPDLGRQAINRSLTRKLVFLNESAPNTTVAWESDGTVAGTHAITAAPALAGVYASTATSQAAIFSSGSASSVRPSSRTPVPTAAATAWWKPPTSRSDKRTSANPSSPPSQWPNPPR